MSPTDDAASDEAPVPESEPVGSDLPEDPSTDASP